MESDSLLKIYGIRIFLAFLLVSLQAAVAQNSLDTRAIISGRVSKRTTPMHKVELTQRGYIQFLRWELPVPEIEEFTFCLWVKSSNLTLDHSIFSYSKDERIRLVRSWISARGSHIHLEIDNRMIFVHPTEIRENQWYHICQSWDNRQARYGLWINGNIVHEGRDQQMIGHVIPSNGDIVLGQEYTDFDAGLEEGIEGAVLGFNLLLVSAFPESIESPQENFREEVTGLSDQEYLVSLMKNYPILRRPDTSTGSRGIRKESRWNLFGPIEERIKRQQGREVTSEGSRVSRSSSMDTQDSRKPLGFQLIETSYNHCEIGRGSPFIGGDSMLISWTRTPVRIFGGAILKNVNNECGRFGDSRFL